MVICERRALSAVKRCDVRRVTASIGPRGPRGSAAGPPPLPEHLSQGENWRGYTVIPEGSETVNTAVLLVNTTIGYNLLTIMFSLF